MEESQQIKSIKISELAEKGGWCDKLLEDTTNYYKNIIKTLAIPYIEDFIDALKGESADTYYSSNQKTVLSIQDLEQVLHVLKSESYGAK